MAWLFLFLQIGLNPSSFATSEQPALSKETIIFRTNFGDFAFRLYPKEAPAASEQILRLVKNKAYVGVEIFRIIPSFVAQIADVKSGPIVMGNSRLIDSIRKLGVEARHLKHAPMKLTLAHQLDDENSGESSFSIVLADSPHLDGKYTVFGEIVAGSGVIYSLSTLDLFPGKDSPVYRVVVESSDVVQMATEKLVLKDSPEITDEFKKIYLKAGAYERAHTLKDYFQHIFYSIVMGLTLLLGAVWFYVRKNQRFMISLILLSVLSLTYGLVQLLVHVPVLPVSWGGAVTYLAVLGVIKLMSRFENL